MIPAPNLDDRTFEDIVQEAITLIPKYCPEWTNHNATDPGVTLIELFAWMTEMVIYRLNKVTDKNYLAFLELMGIHQQPPQPAQALLCFRLVDKAEAQQVPAGTRVATVQTASEDAIVFETVRDLQVLPNQLMKVYSQFHDTFEDHTEFVDGSKPNGFAVFQGSKSIERVLYIGDPRFSMLNDAAILRLNFTVPDTVGSDFPRFLEWQYWNGRRWKEMITSAMEFSRGEIVFDQIDQIEPTEVNGIAASWIRGRLVEVPQSLDATVLDTVQARVEVVGEGVLPDNVLTNDDANNFIPRDLGKNFAPFSENPKPDTSLYIASQEYFCQPGSQVRIEVRLSDPNIKEPGRATEDLLIHWEFFDGKMWQTLAIVGPEGVEESLQGSDFEDSTMCFTQTGSIAFNRPEDMQIADVIGHENYWVRARINQGGYGVPGQYELDGDKWVWRDENPLRPPFLKAMRLNYSEPSQPARHVLSFNDFHYADHTEAAANELKPFQPFQPIAEESPSLYLGFDRPFPNAPVSIFVNTVENLGLEMSSQFKELLVKHYAEQRSQGAEQRVVWEYWAGQEWVGLGVNDRTDNFTQSGMIDFVGPKNLLPTKRFGESLYWLRARLEMGGYVELPYLNHIALNCVHALNYRTIYNETLGSSDGTPHQVFETNYAPVLEDEAIWVRERDKPSAEAIAKLKDEINEEILVEEATDSLGGYWVHWASVDSFYASGPNDRHYKKEPIQGKIEFGDGARGMAPPMGEGNVVARLYRVGGGSRGNVGAGSINTLKRAISYIDSIYNPYPAAGGSDQESIHEIKERGPYMIRSRHRAVTKEDFEWLALQASNSIARATCLPSTDREGEVTVIIIPKFDEVGTDYREKLLPSTELIRRVKRFLDERRLVTTLVNVQKPRYVEVSVRIDIIRASTGSSEKVKRGVEVALRRFLHPIRGSRDGKGWPFGRAVLKMDLYHVVEEVGGVEFVDQIRLIDEDHGIEVEQIKIGPGELPYLVDVDISEKARENLL